MSVHLQILAVSLIGLILFKGCDKAPKYEKPPVQTPAAYKEIAPDNFKETDDWKFAQPKDDVIRGKWWEMFNDPQLNALEEQVNISNQNIALADANFHSARALVKESRSQLFPTVTTSPSIITSRQSSRTTQSNVGAGQGVITDYSLPFDVTWEPDLWGRIRNTVKVSVAEAQATAADLENVRLSVQAELAADYYQLREVDAQKQLLDSTVVAYQQALELTEVRFQTGIASDEDVAQAETQLAATQAQATDLGIARAQLEHAIALLTGQPASVFSIAIEPLKAEPPAIPFGFPSQLLERRPDIAAAERRVAEANAHIGVTKAAFFPSLTLSGAAGFASSSIASWFAWPARFFSVGPSLAQTLFDKGKRKAATEQARAEYDGTVASYRQTVLTAFQEVEDNLAALRILSREIEQQDSAVKSAERALALATDRYKSGIDSYLNVITAQATLLSNQRTAENLRMQQMTASVQLIKALGGGWNASQLPTAKELASKTPLPAPDNTDAKPTLTPEPNITMEQAREIALRRVSGDVEANELKTDHGHLVYSFDIRNAKGTITEVQVDAPKSKVVRVKEKKAKRESDAKHEEGRKP
ncbi:MAG TPA: efflux transporter outer membrane subunit [Pyrinomonadaceae bacterium]